MDKYAELEKLAQLKEKGILSDEEFNIEKKKLLESETQSRQENKDNSVETSTEFISHPYYYNHHNDNFLSILFSHKGRINRLQYIGYIIGVYLLFGILVTLSVSMEMITGEGLQIFFGLLVFVILYIVWILHIKRFHDFNQSGWFGLIPVYNFIAPLFFSGDNSDNRFGPPPK